MGLPEKRKIVQAIIDDEESGWIIMKPSVVNPTDPDPLCIFENPAKFTQATVEIPNEWFHKQELEKIRQAIHEGLQHAKVQLKDMNQET